jgi:hypothetical protein
VVDLQDPEWIKAHPIPVAVIEALGARAGAA